MTLSVEATYEDGVLKPLSPLPLKEHEKVRVTINADADWRAGRVRATAGLLGFKGDPKIIERLALDPALDVDESP